MAKRKTVGQRIAERYFHERSPTYIGIARVIVRELPRKAVRK